MSVADYVVIPSRPVESLRLGSGVESTLARIRGEYHEMPGLSLTAIQARRLFSLVDLDLPMCEALLNRLVAEGFLRRGSNGLYHLASST